MLIRSEEERKLTKAQKKESMVSAITGNLAFVPKVGPFLAVGAELLLNNRNRKEVKKREDNIRHIDNMSEKFATSLAGSGKSNLL